MPTQQEIMDKYSQHTYANSTEMINDMIEMSSQLEAIGVDTQARKELVLQQIEQPNGPGQEAKKMLAYNSGSNVQFVHTEEEQMQTDIAAGKSVKDVMANLSLVTSGRWAFGNPSGIGGLGGLSDRTSPEDFQKLQEEFNALETKEDKEAFVKKTKKKNPNSNKRADDIGLSETGELIHLTDLNQIRENNLVGEAGEESIDEAKENQAQLKAGHEISNILEEAKQNGKLVHAVGGPQLSDDKYLLNYIVDQEFREKANKPPHEVFAVQPDCHYVELDKDKIKTIQYEGSKVEFHGRESNGMHEYSIIDAAARSGYTMEGKDVGDFKNKPSYIAKPPSEAAYQYPHEARVALKYGIEQIKQFYPEAQQQKAILEFVDAVQDHQLKKFGTTMDLEKDAKTYKGGMDDLAQDLGVDKAILKQAQKSIMTKKERFAGLSQRFGEEAAKGMYGKPEIAPTQKTLTRTKTIHTKDFKDKVHGKVSKTAAEFGGQVVPRAQGHGRGDGAGAARH